MNKSLSVIVSVHNAQATLAQQVTELLDLLPELTTNFELLIFDNGSRDGTEEIACDLGLCYPQVRHLRYEHRVDSDVALQAGMSRTHGETIIFFDDQTSSSADALHLLWQHRKSEESMDDGIQPEWSPASPKWLERLMDWGKSLRDIHATKRGLGGVKVIRRPAMQHGLTAVGGSLEGHFSRADDVSEDLFKSNRPNFLQQVKQFTFNE